MYISSMGFKTKDEAESEMARIIEHKEEYTGALTISEHIKKRLGNPC